MISLLPLYLSITEGLSYLIYKKLYSSHKSIRVFVISVAYGCVASTTTFMLFFLKASAKPILSKGLVFKILYL